MKTKTKPKESFKTVCPWCKKNILVKKFEEVLKPSVKSEKKIWFESTKDTQTKLPKGDKKA